MVRKLHIKESIYTDNGYKNRNDYLKSLADEFGVPLSTVKELSDILGADEDFDGLVSELDCMPCDDYDEVEEKWFDYVVNHIGNNRFGLLVFNSKSEYKKLKGNIAKWNDISIEGYNNRDELNTQVANTLVSCNCFIEVIDRNSDFHSGTLYDSKRINWQRIKDFTEGRAGYRDYPDIVNEIRKNKDLIDPEIVGDINVEVNIGDMLSMARLGVGDF